MRKPLGVFGRNAMCKPLAAFIYGQAEGSAIRKGLVIGFKWAQSTPGLAFGE